MTCFVFDPTSTYFERDEAGEDGTAAFRAYGHSKDNRADLPQVVIGLAVTREGIPVRVCCWPGNTSDMSVIGEVKDNLRGWRLGRVVTVVDRGFLSDANLAYRARRRALDRRGADTRRLPRRREALHRLPQPC